MVRTDQRVSVGGVARLVMGLAVLALAACESRQLPTEPGVSVSSEQVFSLAQALQSLNTGDAIPGHYIVRFDDDVTDAFGLARAITRAVSSSSSAAVRAS